MRQVINFNENWLFKKANEIATTVPADYERINLPHTWNNKDGQDGGNDYYRGTCTYVKVFNKPEHDGKVFIEFKGVGHTSDVFLNGEKLAHHEGGYSTFRVELNDLKEENIFTVNVDNSDNDHVYPQKADFTFYGGIYRDVNLILVPNEHFELIKDGTPGIKVTPIVEGNKANVKVETWQNGEGEVTYTLNGEIKKVNSLNGHAEVEFVIENVHLWDGLNDPYLYEVKAAYNGDEVCTRFGCRTMEFDSEKGFFLNGKSYPLRGVARHQDRIELGNAITLKEHKEDMELIKEIGANTIRLAHYQHAGEFYDLCDEVGMVVWAEIPYITMHMKNGRENTLSQMKELITQNYNHPSICCWGLSNEITAASKVNDDLLENHKLLNDLCHKMDSTRPTTMANVFMLEIDSPIHEIPDISSYNLYFGWYVGELNQNEEFFDEYHAKYPNRVIGFSEYGADCNPQYHSIKPERGDYTEEYQCLYHEHIINMIEERPYLWATHVWNMFDFAADGRDEGGKNGQNQKGLVTFDRKTRKDAFYLYKAHWSKDPFVYITGRRYVNRCEDKTNVKVYSNQDEVSLYVDGNLLESKKGKHAFTFEVTLNGKHELKAVSGKLVDTIEINKVDKADESYQFLKQDIINWFDKEEIDPTCFSIKDTMGELQSNPQTAAILGKMMAASAASRGDVAEATKDNPNLQKMLARMSLETLIKQAGGIDPEQVKQLNAVLQKIKK